ncbi:MAG: AAA family ATPase, partial [Burkholderiales bacterium]|nr:AAA family ATPase [Burkholderiales bacterium]
VAIGQAIIHQPKLLLLDEPASGLDPEARASLASLFRQLQKEGMTLLVSSHILAELDEYSTAMLALRAGQVLEQRNLHQEASEDALVQLHIQLLQPDTRAVPLLIAAGAQFSPTGSTGTDPCQIVCRFSAERGRQAALLAQLVREGIALCGFSTSKENLQQSYLRSLANANNSAPNNEGAQA